MTTAEASQEIQVIQGPTIPNRGAQYQVTLANGMMLTSPSDFGADAEREHPSMVISEDGQILSDFVDATDSVGTVY